MEQSTIEPSYKTDHSMITISIKGEKDLQKGKGFWKLNASILADKDNVERINNEIETAVTNTVGNTPNAHWEHIKEKCIKVCQQISKQRAERNNREFSELKKK